MSRLDASETVRIGAIAGRADPICARAYARAPAGQILRKAQVDAVVNRHHRAARRQRRQHVVRLVKDMGPCAQERERQAELLADRDTAPRCRPTCGSSRRARPRPRGLLPGRSGRSRSRGRIARARARCCGCTCRCRSRAACGHRSPLSRSQPLHPQVSLQPRRPAGQVLAIIGQVALLPRAYAAPDVVTPDRPRRCTISATGEKTIVRPFARIAAQRSTSST